MQSAVMLQVRRPLVRLSVYTCDVGGVPRSYSFEFLKWSSLPGDKEVPICPDRIIRKFQVEYRCSIDNYSTAFFIVISTDAQLATY